MRRSLDDGIRATVESAISSGDILHIPQESKRLAAAYPECGLDLADIAELLLKAGVSARVALELGGLRDGPAIGPPAAQRIAG